MFAIFSGLAVSDPMPAREELHVLSSHFQVILMQRNSTFAVFPILEPSGSAVPATLAAAC